MSPRSDAFRAALRRQDDEAARLRFGMLGLETLYADLIRSSVPANPQFEVERIILSLPNRREIVFVLGALTEGENEAALLLALMDRMLEADPAAATSHVLTEAAYYLRTSIDPTWQPQEQCVTAEAAMVYLFTILESRLERLRSLPVRPTAQPGPDNKSILEALQAEFARSSRLR